MILLDKLSVDDVLILNDSSMLLQAVEMRTSGGLLSEGVAGIQPEDLTEKADRRNPERGIQEEQSHIWTAGECSCKWNAGRMPEGSH